MSLVLVPVAALPSGPTSHPELWRRYLIPKDATPPYDPPYIGPRKMDREWLNSLSGLTINQKSRIRAKHQQLYDKAVNSLLPFLYFLEPDISRMSKGPDAATDDLLAKTDSD